jgi:NADP-reducing hydrogenase subunit HndB
MNGTETKKIDSFDQLKKLKDDLIKLTLQNRTSDSKEQPVIVKIAMATCSLASGAKEVFQFFSEELEKRGITARVKKTGCMGYCYAEPTVEISLPGSNPVVFGNVDKTRADEIIEKYIKNKENIEGTLLLS